MPIVCRPHALLRRWIGRGRDDATEGRQSGNDAPLRVEFLGEWLPIPQEAMPLVKAVCIGSVIAARHFQLYASD